MTGHAGIVVYRSLGGTALVPGGAVSDEYPAAGHRRRHRRRPPDLVATGGELRVYRQLADGTFAGAVHYPVEGRYSSAVAIGDLSGDGRADVVVANGWGNSLDTSEINILTQTPSGTLGAPTSYVNPKPETLRVADVDRDRRNDIVVSHDGSVGLMLHLADGRFTPEQSFPLRYSAPPRHRPGGGRRDRRRPARRGRGRPQQRAGPPAQHRPRTPAQKATRHVARMARDLLGRPPTAPESAAWTPIVGTPTGRVNLAVALVRGTEYRTRFINEHALLTVGHHLDPATTVALLDVLARGAIVDIVPAFVLGSDEYFVRLGSDPELFVANLFATVFGVPLDAANRAALAAVVRSGYSRIALAVHFLVHPAARAHLVDLTYQRYLGHGPSPEMRAWWVDAIGRGVVPNTWWPTWCRARNT